MIPPTISTIIPTISTVIATPIPIASVIPRSPRAKRDPRRVGARLANRPCRPVDQPEEVIVTAAATQSSGEDDPLNLVHHLGGTWPTSAYQAIDD